MPTEIPIACSLDAQELPERLDSARTLGADALVGVEASGSRAVLTFKGERERVEALWDAESRCCSFLDFETTVADDTTQLVIETAPGGEPILRSLVAGVVAGWEGGL